MYGSLPMRARRANATDAYWSFGLLPATPPPPHAPNPAPPSPSTPPPSSPSFRASEARLPCQRASRWRATRENAVRAGLRGLQSRSANFRIRLWQMGTQRLFWHDSGSCCCSSRHQMQCKRPGISIQLLRRGADPIPIILAPARHCATTSLLKPDTSSTLLTAKPSLYAEQFANLANDAKWP